MSHRDYETERRWTVHCNECDDYEVVDTCQRDAETRREWHDCDDLEVVPWNKIIEVYDR